ncbi:MAG: glycosyltransferase family 39 protein, partial [Nocardiopsaceae bacterium]|nr:glycosyltransferase family 39 protein [Nocardiopsaceae bacterium]
MTTGPENGRGRQDVASLRPGQEKDRERSTFQKAEAETVMFASARALPINNDDALIAQPTQQEAYKFQIHPRRARLSRVVLLSVLVMQVLLTVRMHNTASPDEASTLLAGHAELAHLSLARITAGAAGIPAGATATAGAPLPGAPVFCPVLDALVGNVGGLGAVRVLSLLEALLATALLYALTRRLFNERVALCTGIGFAVAEPTLLAGYLAGYDATALFLLALAAWLVVRTGAIRGPAFLLAA